MFSLLILSAAVYHRTTASPTENELKRGFHSCSTPDSERPIDSTAKHSGCTNTSPSEVSQKSPFGCGCGKCRFFSFIERGCPAPIPSASSFPYLDLSGLTDEQQQELKGRLQFES